MEPIVRTLRPVALIVAGLAAFALLAAVAWQPAPEAAMQPRYTESERAYMAEMAEILDVPEVLPEGSLAGARNACFWIDHYGLDPRTLEGWDQYWSYAWERQWLAAAVRHICPA